MSEIKLKPCPFCGTTPKIKIGVIRSLEYYVRLTVFCPECKTSKYHDLASESSFDDVEEVLDKVAANWNRRKGVET